MSRLVIASALLLASALATAGDGTRPDFSSIIFNNSGADIAVLLAPAEREFVTMAPGQQTRSWLIASHIIRIRTADYLYVLPEHVVSYAGPATIQLQMEHDGLLYYVPYTMNLPALRVPAQPPGFPVRPMNAGESI